MNTQEANMNIQSARNSTGDIVTPVDDNADAVSENQAFADEYLKKLNDKIIQKEPTTGEIFSHRTDIDMQEEGIN